ncbi:MAG: hypothetical protein ACFFCZ_01075 [Promethearchaeota archaeon]
MLSKTIPPEWDVQVWFSIGTTTGLSIVSIGTPGLKSELDEQVFAGGMTAISHLLGSEIGVTQDEFIGGGDTSRIGRFKIVNTAKERDAIAQFLLVSRGTKIPQLLVEFSIIFIKYFGASILDSVLWDKVEEQHAVLDISETLELILEGFSRARLQIGRGKIPPIETALNEAIKQQINRGISDFSFSDSLEELSIMPFQEALSIINSKRGQLLEEFALDCLLAVLETNPLALILMENPRNAIPSAKKTLKSQFSILGDQIVQHVEKLSQSLFDREINEVLDAFNLINLRAQKKELTQRIQKDLTKKIVQKHPLLFLINPALKARTGSLDQVVEKLVASILDEHDLGGTLGKVTAEILPNDNLSRTFTADFIRTFCNVSSGLTKHAWSFIKAVYEVLCYEYGKDLETVIKEAEIAQSHKEMIQKKILTKSKSIKLGKSTKKSFVPGITFRVQEAEIFQRFLAALTGTITRGVQLVFNRVIFSPNSGIGILPQVYAQRLEELSNKAQIAQNFINALEYITNKRWSILDIEGCLPNLRRLGDVSNPKIPFEKARVDFKTLQKLWTDPKIINKAFLKEARAKIQNICFTLSENLDDLERVFITNLEKLENFLKSSKKSYEALNIEVAQIRPLESQYAIIFEELYRQIIQIANDSHNQVKKIFELVKSVKKPSKNGIVASRQQQRIINEINQQIKKIKAQNSAFKNTIRNLQIRSERELDRDLSKTEKELFQTILNSKNEIFKTRKPSKNAPYESFKATQITNFSKEIAAGYKQDPFTINGQSFDVARFYGYAVLFNDVPRPFKTAVLNQCLIPRRTPKINELINRWHKNDLKSLSGLLVDNLTGPAKNILLDALQSQIHKVETIFLQQNPLVVGWKGEVCIEIGRVDYSLFQDENFETYLGNFFRYAAIEDKKYVRILLPLCKDYRTIDNFIFALRRHVFREVWDALEPILNLIEFSCNVFSERTAELFKEMILPFQKYEF